MRRRRPVRLVAIALVLAAALPATAHADRPFAIRYTANDAGSITFAANTLMTCPSSAPTCPAAQAGTQGGTLGNNNGYAMTYVDADGLPGTFDSSSANLTVPADAVVLWAGLYWAGDTAAAPGGAQAPTPAAKGTVSFRPAGAAGYGTVTAQTLDTNTSRYGAFADVTDLVRTAGAGSYSVANVQSGTGEDRYAAWDLIVVFRDSTQPPRNLTVFDGLATVSRATPVATASLSGFLTPATGPVRSTVGLWSSEGDRTSTGDSATLNSTPITDASNPANNVFNSSISRFGFDVTDKNPNYVNQLGSDMNLFQEDGVLPNGATSASIRLTTGGETYYPQGVFFTTDLFAPKIRPAKSVVDVNGGPTERGDELEYTVNVTNEGQDPAVSLRFFDTIPAQTAYVPGSLAVTTVPTANGACGTNFVPQSDAVDNGLAEFDPDAGRTVFRLGSGATDTAGGRLDPGQTVCARFRVRVAGDAPLGSEIVNQGYASFIGATLGTQFPDEVSNPVTTVISGADLVPSKTHAGGVFVGGRAYDFTINVADAGDVATNGTVTVEDPFDPTQFSSVNSAGGAGWSCSTAASTVTCTRADPVGAGASYPPITVNATVADPAPATVVNVATVSGGGDIDDSNNSAIDSGGAVAQADLGITKAADQEVVPARGEVTFTLDVVNRGPSAASAVRVTDALAPNFAALEITSSQGTCSDDVVCDLGALARNGRATITIRARVLDAAADSTVTNAATVTDTGASDDPVPDNDRAEAVVDVPLSSDLRVDKSFAPAPNPTAGALVTFTVLVGNDGPSTAENVVTDDVLPDTYYDTTVAPVATVTGGGTCAWLAAARNVRCAVGTLTATQQETITITARLRPDSRGKTVLNSVGAISDSVDPNPGLATDTVSFVPIPAADLELTKLAPPDPVAPGGVARYTFRVANRGPSDAPDVVVRDTLPAGLTFLADTRGACTATGQALTCRLGTLPAGSAIDDLGVDVLVDPSLAGRTVRNAASVASEPSDPLLAPAETIPASNQDAADLVVGPAPPTPSPSEPGAPPAPANDDLAIRVVAPKGPVHVGDRTSWRLDVTNAGPITATGVQVTATPSGGSILPGARVSQVGCSAGSCSLETLGPGASRTIAVTVRPTRRGTLTLTGTVRGNEAETRSDNNRDRGSVTVQEAKTSLALSTRPSTSTVKGGRTLRLTVTVRNRGHHTARGLTVCQRLPGTLRPSGLGGARLRGGVPCWRIRSLGASRSRSFVLTVRAARVTRSVRVVATVRAENARSRRATARVRITSPRRPPRFTG